MAGSQAWVALGVVGAPHGVRGALRARLYNPESALLLEQPQLWLRRADAPPSPHRIDYIQPHGGGLLLELEGVNSREAAEALRGAELCVPRSALPALGPGEHYFVDLIGLTAVDRDGKPLGRVADVQQYPASQVLCLELDGGRYEVPMREPYLVEVQLEAGQVVVDQLADLEPVPPKRPRARSKR